MATKPKEKDIGKELTNNPDVILDYLRKKSDDEFNTQINTIKNGDELSDLADHQKADIRRIEAEKQVANEALDKADAPLKAHFANYPDSQLLPEELENLFDNVKQDLNARGQRGEPSPADIEKYLLKQSLKQMEDHFDTVLKAVGDRSERTDYDDFKVKISKNEDGTKKALSEFAGDIFARLSDHFAKTKPFMDALEEKTLDRAEVTHVSTVAGEHAAAITNILKAVQDRSPPLSEDELKDKMGAALDVYDELAEKFDKAIPENKKLSRELFNYKLQVKLRDQANGLEFKKLDELDIDGEDKGQIKDWIRIAEEKPFDPEVSAGRGRNEGGKASNGTRIGMGIGTGLAAAATIALARSGGKDETVTHPDGTSTTERKSEWGFGKVLGVGLLATATVGLAMATFNGGKFVGDGMAQKFKNLLFGVSGPSAASGFAR